MFTHRLLDRKQSRRKVDDFSSLNEENKPKPAQLILNSHSLPFQRQSQSPARPKQLVVVMIRTKESTINF
jgi:hypothetical protein